MRLGKYLSHIRVWSTLYFVAHWREKEKAGKRWHIKIGVRSSHCTTCFLQGARSSVTREYCTTQNRKHGRSLSFGRKITVGHVIRFNQLVLLRPIMIEPTSFSRLHVSFLYLRKNFPPRGLKHSLFRMKPTIHIHGVKYSIPVVTDPGNRCLHLC